MPTVMHRLAALVLGLLAFVVYLANLRTMGSADTIPTRLLPFSMLREGNLDLDEFQWLRLVNPEPYFLKRDAAGHWRSKYPVVTAIVAAPLAAPFVWWSRAAGMSDIDARFRLLVTVFDRVAAALFAAMSVMLVFLAARELAPERAALVAALFYAFGTNTWATSSQSLWQHGLAQVGLAGAALCLLRGDGRRAAIVAGILTGLAVGARPQAAIIAVVMAAYFGIERRADLKLFLAPVVLMVGAVLIYNLTVMERATGGYTTGGIRMLDPERLAGLLVSPSRGLFIYCPLAILAFAALARASDSTERLLRWLAAAVTVYTLFYAGFVRWWAGHSYGPRFFAEVMPFFTLCALPTAQRLWQRTVPRALLIAGLLWCVGVQIIGVYCDDNGWNRWPVSVDSSPSRLWDWSDTQMVRAVRSGWHGGELATLLRQLVSDPNPAPLVPLEWEDLQAAVMPLGGVPMRFRAGTGGPLDIRIVNRSRDAVWPAFSDIGDLEVGISVVWKSNGVMVQRVGDFHPLRKQLGPGMETEMHEWIEAPKQAGQYDLELNLVQNQGNSGRFGGGTLTVAAVVE